MTSYLRLALVLSILLGLSVSAGSNGNAPRVLADGPCDSALGDPHPPVGPSEPYIGGAVTNSATMAGISGATIALYRCTGSTAVYVDSATTNAYGVYLFPDLSSPAWYYVQAEMTGPLSGLSPSGGTLNPSDAVDIGDGATVNFSFE